MEADWKDRSVSPALCHSISANRKRGISEHSTKTKKKALLPQQVEVSFSRCISWQNSMVDFQPAFKLLQPEYR
ncbi:hypothetical protein KUCAC02_001347 [Chaenocephalus aceratus]|uniref:Uncharacterized protein n=1 Tax=Chaenocephalus aceratus TaxID=36190 RepID=A0ACB9XWQ3_CHAAC|nr:hypothetical protein KUCAC02_001347 [Chaenocephalus aceratus]